MRGSGDSEGFYYDEYEKQEQDDCCDVINWISQQKWCTGNVGKSSLRAKIFWLGYTRFCLFIARLLVDGLLVQFSQRLSIKHVNCVTLSNFLD